MTLDEFKQLDPEAQRATLADMRRRGNELINGLVAQELAGFFEAQLVPRLEFKPSRIEVAPPIEDPETAARDFFRRFPDTKAIRIGNVLFERG